MAQPTLDELWAKGLGNLSDDEQKLFVKLLNADEERKYQEVLERTRQNLRKLIDNDPLLKSMKR